MATAENKRYKLTVRFGDELLQEGHTSVPNLVVRSYAQLGIKPAEMMFIIHIWEYWWTEKDPFPGLQSIATRMNQSRRWMRKYVSSLKEKGYLNVNERKRSGQGQITSEYDFEPLIAAILACSRRDDGDTGAGKLRKNDRSQGGRNNPSGAPGKHRSPEGDELKADEDTSKFRKVNQPKILEKGREDPRPASLTTGVPGSGRRQFEAVGEFLKDRAPAPPAPSNELSASDREILMAFWEPMAPEMRDSAPYSTVTELLRYFEQSNLERVTDMMPVIYQARAITKERTSSIRNGEPGARNMVPYFKSVVRDKLGLKKKSQDKKDDDSPPAETPA